jgi:hypothetical protein
VLAGPANSVRQGHACHLLVPRGIVLWISRVERIRADLKCRLAELKAMRLTPTHACASYATGKPREHPLERRGNLVQLDTLRLIPLRGLDNRQFTAVAVVPRSNVPCQLLRHCRDRPRVSDSTASAHPFPKRAPRWGQRDHG